MKTKSIWGRPPKRLYNLIHMAEKQFGKFSTCIVGCSDGKFLMPFARREQMVTGYDIDDIALYGGTKLFPKNNHKYSYTYTPFFVSPIYELEEKQVMGVVERIEKEGLQKFARVEKRDFYGSNNTEKFDVVFTSCSLHYSANKRFTLCEKVKKLQEIVAPNGFLYMDYMMAIDENDHEKYPAVKFFRKGEILQYFDNSWEILWLKENNKITPEKAHVDCVVDHFHRFGYLLARRKND